MEKGAITNNRFGNFHHVDIIGKKYGAKIHSRTGKGWMYALRPTPDLYTVALEHRTQILFTTDISMVCLYLDLKPGKVVVESGTGSGSLSTSIARCIAPTGHLHTFEFNEHRATKAREDFERHGLSPYITVTCGDACSNGFGAALTDSVDAVFLDLPNPWVALVHATNVLKTGGRLCSFSPCIEQVQRVCTALPEQGYEDIVTVEMLLRPFEIRTVELDVPEFESDPTGSKRLRASDEPVADNGLERSKRPRTAPSTVSKVLASGSRPFHEMRGHTSYLTFATKGLPRS
eukprot:GILK01005423.1.p1 GENE.GILK01005423.1~~GILK01005423.1.p1  ORF type:complete len:333 (-),score=56.89 GILK01005423.1:151-1017(-)